MKKNTDFEDGMIVGGRFLKYLFNEVPEDIRAEVTEEYKKWLLTL